MGLHAGMTRSPLAVILGLCLLTTAVYLPAVWTAPYVWEDFNATTLDDPHAPPIAPLRVRAVTRLSYRFDRFVADNQPNARPYHLTNLALHLLNGGLLFYLALQISPLATAALATALFLLHPLQSESVMYIASRTELLSTGLILAACLSASRGAWTRLRAVWVLTLLTFAASAKESAIVGFALVPWWLSLQDRFAFPTVSFRAWRRHWATVVVCALVIAGMITTTIYHEYLPYGHSPLSIWGYASLQATALWHYLAMILIPVGQTLDHDWEAIPRWGQILSGVALYSITALALLTWAILTYEHRMGMALRETDTTPESWDYPRMRLGCWGLLWCMIALAPRLVMKIPEVLVEHQLYLPFIGLYLALAGYLTGLTRLSRVGRFADTRSGFTMWHPEQTGV